MKAIRTIQHRLSAGRQNALDRLSMHGTMVLVVLALLACPGHVARATGSETNMIELQTPRDFYNAGTARLQEMKLTEAEPLLQSAVASNDEVIQPRALFNLGHTRYAMGLEALKKGPDSERIQAHANETLERVEAALQTGQSALAGDDVDAIVTAYRLGRGARKDLKGATEAVKKALETHGTVLNRWHRAAGDFKSAFELVPTDTEAKTNATIIDQRIIALVDQQEMAMMAMGKMSQQTQKLKQMMKMLKERLPKDSEEGKQGDEDEEDQDKPKEPKQGEQESPSQEGKKTDMNRDDAMRLLESLKLDSNRKLPMGMKDTSQTKDKKGREW